MYYYYDIQNRLVAVTNTTKDIAWSCEYDVFGNRTKVIDHGTEKETLFVQGSLASAVAEFDGEGVVATHHILLGSVRIADVSPLTTSHYPLTTIYYHSDGLASTRLLTDANGDTIGTASYNAFGSIRTTGGSQSLATSAGWVGTLGVERDDATGLIFMRNRYYDAEQGRFIQIDPIGYRSGEVNWYRYCMGNPVRFIDPNGLVTGEMVSLTELCLEAVVNEGSAAGADYIFISTVEGAGGATMAGTGVAAGGTTGVIMMETGLGIVIVVEAVVIEKELEDLMEANADLEMAKHYSYKDVLQPRVWMSPYFRVCPIGSEQERRETCAKLKEKKDADSVFKPTYSKNDAEKWKQLNCDEFYSK